MADIRVEDLCKIYNQGKENEVRALNGVSFSAKEGEFIVIIGPSGAGKSTLLNLLGGMDTSTSGSYWIGGQDASKFNAKQLQMLRREKIGFVFQFYNLMPNLTALENVELPLIYRGVSKKERIELSTIALEKVGLGKRMDHKPSEMSGGQQQRVAIARAIAQAPPIILADEPTGNLDTGSTREIMSILKELHEEGRTVILITHDTQIASQAKRVIKIMDGKVIEDYEQSPAESCT